MTCWRRIEKISLPGCRRVSADVAPGHLIRAMSQNAWYLAMTYFAWNHFFPLFVNCFRFPRMSS